MMNLTQSDINSICEKLWSERNNIRDCNDCGLNQTSGI